MSKLVNWRIGEFWMEKYAGRGCARVTGPRWRREAQDICAAGECVGPQPCNNRPLLKEARSAGQQQRRTSSQIPPPMVLHFPRIPLLLESTSSCLGRYFSSDSSHIAELPVTMYHSYRGLHQCNRIENTTLGLQQLHDNAPSPISITAKRTVRGINSHIWSNPS